MVASFSEIEPYIIQSESGGNNYTSAQNVNYPTSTASGYYQITNSTWSGIPTSITGGVASAYQAPFATQQAAAEYLWNTNNGSDWLCPGCNSTVVNANNALTAGIPPSTYVSPNVSNLIGGGGTEASNNYGLGDANLNQLNDPAYVTGLPTYGDATASDTTGLPFGSTGNTLPAEGYYGGSLHVNVSPTQTAATVGSGSPAGSVTNTGVLQSVTGASGAGTPVQVNLGAGTVADIGKWIQAPITAAEQAMSGWLATFENWVGRGFIILVAIVILAVALWHVAGKPQVPIIMEA